MTGPPFLRPLFAACLLGAAWLAYPVAPVSASPVLCAATVSAAPPLPFADGDGWGVRKLLGGMNSRSRIIQVAIACMCLGLFILMRKFNA
jgi:hypothetical protein